MDTKQFRLPVCKRILFILFAILISNAAFSQQSHNLFGPKLREAVKSSEFMQISEIADFPFDIKPSCETGMFLGRDINGYYIGLMFYEYGKYPDIGTQSPLTFNFVDADNHVTTLKRKEGLSSLKLKEVFHTGNIDIDFNPLRAFWYYCNFYFFKIDDIDQFLSHDFVAYNTTDGTLQYDRRQHAEKRTLNLSKRLKTYRKYVDDNFDRRFRRTGIASAADYIVLDWPYYQ